MKYNYDRIVVGGGFSGLMAAISAAENNKSVLLLTKGAGALTVGGGVVDFYGSNTGKPVSDPHMAILSLPETHPYKILGNNAIATAFGYFEKLTAEFNYPYKHVNGKNSWLPTAIGTTKPTYFIPQPSNPEVLQGEDNIAVVGVIGLKDFYPELIIQGLHKKKAYSGKNFSIIRLPCPFDGGRDLTALDLARYVDNINGLQWLSKSLKNTIGNNKAVIIPPILGTYPSYDILNALEANIGGRFYETPVMPPSVQGLRLRHILITKLKQLNVRVIELADVVRADVDAGICSGVYTSAPDKERKYSAERFIIATGGFFGGGCLAEPGKAYEAIFNLDFGAPANQEEWSSPLLLGNEPHLFASMGVKINRELLAVDNSGSPILKNVHFVGRTVGGYDYTSEKSGNGVALVTGYTAGRI